MEQRHRAIHRQPSAAPLTIAVVHASDLPYLVICIALVATLTRTPATMRPNSPWPPPMSLNPPDRRRSLQPVEAQALARAREDGWTLHQTPATGRWHATRGRAATRTYPNRHEAALAALARAAAPT